MLAAGDRIDLPPGLRVEEGVLVDEARDLRVAVNPAATVVLARPGRPLDEVAAEIAAAFGLDRERAIDDVLAFAWELNRRGLANVRQAGGRVARMIAWLVLALRLLPSGSLPSSPVRRVTLDTDRYRACVVGVACAIYGRSVVLAALGALAVLQPSALAGRTPVVAAGAVGLGLGAGVLVHEVAHALPLVRICPGAVLVSWRRISVVHPPLPPRRRQVAAAIGPLGAAGVGIVLMLAAVRIHVPELALGGAPMAAHALGLTAFSSDGRHACGT